MNTNSYEFSLFILNSWWVWNLFWLVPVTFSAQKEKKKREKINSLDLLMLDCCYASLREKSLQNLPYPNHHTLINHFRTDNPLHLVLTLSAIIFADTIIKERKRKKHIYFISRARALRGIDIILIYFFGLQVKPSHIPLKIPKKVLHN